MAKRKEDMLQRAFKAIIGLIILAGLVGIGVPIGVGFLINATLPGAPAALVTLLTGLASFVVAILGVYILFNYAISEMT
jgi:drug/metabolite transporter (DMT)-like permease